jgi:hypothetical protein
MSLPDFIIGGAPKCGTTALFEYLNQHPQVFTSTPKEPHFFASEGGETRVRGMRFTRKEYEAFSVKRTTSRSLEKPQLGICATQDELLPKFLN